MIIILMRIAVYKVDEKFNGSLNFIQTIYI